MSDPTPVVTAEVCTHSTCREATDNKRCAFAELDAEQMAAALADVMTLADCASREYPFTDLSRARALLASPEFAVVLGEAQRVAWDAGYRRSTDDWEMDRHTPTPNPYPKAAS